MKDLQRHAQRIFYWIATWETMLLSRPSVTTSSCHMFFCSTESGRCSRNVLIGICFHWCVWQTQMIMCGSLHWHGPPGHSLALRLEIRNRKGIKVFWVHVFTHQVPYAWIVITNIRVILHPVCPSTELGQHTCRSYKMGAIVLNDSIVSHLLMN